MCEEEKEVTMVKGTTSPSFEMLATASNPDNAITKKFKCKESFMAPSGVMMERDVFYLIPTTALNYPNPETYSVGLTYGDKKPQGVLFTGQNRKERRAEEKKKKKSK